MTRLASEYQNTIASATGESSRQARPSAYDAPTKTIDAAVMNTMASVRLIAPRGSSRIAVRGFFASYCASTSRLNPIAALRAATIATTIQATRHATSRGGSGLACSASSAPVKRERQREHAVAEPDE